MGNPIQGQAKPTPMQAKPVKPGVPSQSRASMQSKPVQAVKPVVKPVASTGQKPVQTVGAKPVVQAANQAQHAQSVKPAAQTVKPVVKPQVASSMNSSGDKPTSVAPIGSVADQKKQAQEKAVEAQKAEAAKIKAEENKLKEARKMAHNTHTASEDDITIGLLTDEAFGELLPYIKDVNVTDINWNGRQLWIDDLKKGRYNAQVNLTQTFINQFATRVSNVVSESFNKYNPKLEAETEELRISILHDSVAHTGTSISMRKTPAVRRINFNAQIKNGDYCSEEMANFMSNAVKAGMNIIICGLPGDGKTELLKYLTSYIPPKDRVITVEDNLEIHYHNINPEKDCIELKVDDSFTYVDAIKACLRQLPRWIMLSEARSIEVKYLIEALSTGAHCMTTIHTDDVRKLPNRIKNMVGDSAQAERIEQDVYNFLNMGILIKKRYDEKGNIFRYLSQMAVFDDEKQEVVLIFDEGKRTDREIPSSVLRKFMIAGIQDPFAYTRLKW